VSPIEAVATLLGLANVTLVVRRSLWNYPFALAMVSLYAVIFLRERLYSDALLQGFYFVVTAMAGGTGVAPGRVPARCRSWRSAGVRGSPGRAGRRSPRSAGVR